MLSSSARNDASSKCERFAMLQVVGTRLRTAAGSARLERGVYPVFLVLQVAASEIEHFPHRPGGRGDVVRVMRIDATDDDQHVGHAGPQALVDEGVGIVSNRRFTALSWWGLGALNLPPL